MAGQHSSLTPERWSGYGLDRQILMIANEMHRAGQLVRPGDEGRRRNSYERVLNLVDLTVAVHSTRSLRRELLRWRDLVAELYLAEAPRPDLHRAAFKCLLQFRPEAARQIPLLLPEPAADSGPRLV